MDKSCAKSSRQSNEILVIMKSILTVISQMMGGSIVAVPFLFHQLGLLMSLILMAISVAIALLNYYFMIILSNKFKCSSYRELLSAVVNKKIATVNDILIIIQFIGVMTSYIIVASTCFQSFLINITGQENNKIINNIMIWKVVITLCVILPLCFIKTLNILGYIATFGFLFILLVGFTIIAYFFIDLKQRYVCVYKEQQYGQYDLVIIPKMQPYMQFLKFVMYIPAIQGYFSAQNIIPQLMYELPPNVNKILTVRIAVFISVCLACILYTSIGITGSMMFGNDSNDNILVAFQPCKLVWINICMILNAFVVIVVFPLLIYPIKANIIKWSGHNIKTRKGCGVMIGVTLLFVILPLVLSLVLEQILTVLGLFGSISGCIMLFIGPILLMLYGKRPYDMRDYEEDFKKEKRVKYREKMNQIFRKSKFKSTKSQKDTSLDETTDNNLSSTKLLRPFNRNKYVNNLNTEISTQKEESSHLHHDGPLIIQKDGWETIPIIKVEESDKQVANQDQQELKKQIYQKYPDFSLSIKRKIICYTLLALAVSTCFVSAIMNVREIIIPNK